MTTKVSRSFKNRTDKPAIKQNIKWTFRKVKFLGVWFSTSVEEAAILNYQEKKEKITKILNCWQVRRLTLLGKITVIKSLAASRSACLYHVTFAVLAIISKRNSSNFVQFSVGWKRG